MNFEKFGRTKSNEELSNQIEKTEKNFGERLAPQSIRDDLDKLSLEEIKENYPVRYDQYVQMLRNRNGDEDVIEKDSHVRQFIAGLNSIEDYIQRHENGEKILRDGQKTIFADLQDFLEQGKRSGYVKAPTGIGKTVLFSQLVEALDLKTIVVVPNTKLVSQTSEEFGDFTDLEVGEVYSKAKEFGRQVTVTTYHSLVSKVKSGEFNPDDIDLLVLDEAHRSLGEKRREAISKFEHATKIGFTATLDLVEKSVPDELRHEIHHMGLREACDLGLVSEARNIIVKTDVNLDEVKITSGGNYNEDDLARFLNVEKRNRAAAEIYKENYLGKRAIINCSNIDHAESVAEEFRRKGINAAAVHSKISEEEHERILGNKDKGIVGELHTGETPVVVNVQQLTEGFNEPRVEVVMNLHLTQSPRIAEQRAGRGLRLDPDNPDKVADIIDFVDDISDYRRRPIIFADIIRGATLTKKTKNDKPEEEAEKNRRTSFKTGDIEVEGFEVLTNQEEVESLKRSLDEMMPEELPEAPEGWRSATEIASGLNIGYETIQKEADKYIDVHPEWIKDFRSPSGHRAKYYAPGLVDKLKERDIEKAPEGWKSVTDIMGEVDVSRGAIQEAANEHLDMHPDWAKKYKASNGYEMTHYAPELVRKIEEEFGEAPEGWKSIPDMANEFGSDYSVIKRKVDKHFDVDSNSSKKYRISDGRRVIHYSPEFVKKIAEEYKRAPDGWRTAIDVADDFEVSHLTIKKYSKTYPDWSKKYRAPNGQNMLYIAPELIEKLSKEHQEAPDGWKAIGDIVDAFDFGYQLIKKVVDKHAKDNPDWTGEYKASSGQKITYYAPELVRKIEEEFREAPEGWKTSADIANELGIHAFTAQRKADKYADSHQGLSGKYRASSGHKAMHYAPEVVEKLREEHS